MIQQSLRHFVTTFPALLNQPDKNGNCPLHAALRRMCEYRSMNAWVEQTGLESCMTILLEAKGIDPHVRDGRGNTALHYLADCSKEAGHGLLDVALAPPEGITPPHDERRNAAARELLDASLARGVDVCAPNDAGKTAVRILLENGSAWHQSREEWYGHPLYRLEALDIINAVDAEVLEKWDAAGADWSEKDGKGRTLLYALAMYRTDGTVWRCRFPLEKGVDPSIRDDEGKTAAETAVAFGNTEEIILLLQA